MPSDEERARLLALMSAACRFLFFGAILTAASVQAQEVDIASVECDATQFSVRYVVKNDDLLSNPRLPLSYRVGGESYSVSGARADAEALGMCGAQPPAFISVSRDGIPLLAPVTFGEDCFGGPSLASLSVTKDKKGGHVIKVCVYLDPTVLDVDPQIRTYCASFQESDTHLPITQDTIGEIFRRAKSR